MDVRDLVTETFPRAVEFAQTARSESFAKLTTEALDLLSTLGPIVDVGAGNGWWDRVLAERGVDVVAVEPSRCANEVYPRVRADHRAVVGYPDRALLMIWPTRGATWAAECVRLYRGTTVAYVGDPTFANTASPLLWQVLKADGFTRSARVRVGSWPELFTDTLTVWQRPAS